MTRVAVFNMEIVGTLNPILPVVKELVSKGCEVRYYFNKDTFRKEIQAAGATAERFDDYFLRWDELFEEEAEWLERNGYSASAIAAALPQNSPMFLRMLLASIPAGICLARRLLERWSTWQPDLVLHNCQVLHPFLAAKKLCIPSCTFTTYPGPGTPMHLYALPFEQREAYDEDLARHPAVAPANALAMKWCGVDLLQSQLLCRCFSEDNIVFSIPELQGVMNENQRLRLQGSRIHWVGATDPELQGLSRVSGEALEAVEKPEGVKLVLVSLGSLTVEFRWVLDEHVSSLGMFNGKQYATRLWSELIDTFGNREDVKVILAIGSREEASELLEDLPKNFVAMKFLDQIGYLKQTDLFITHGGFNSIKEATLLGVPMIVTPFCVDQPCNGEAIEAYGAGQCFRDLMATERYPHPASLGCAANRLLADPVSCAEKSAELGEGLRSAGGAKAAGEVCLRLLARAARGGA